jgi:hypothetical protein
MPPQRKYGKSAKHKAKVTNSRAAISARYHGEAAHQFPASKDDDYVTTASSLSDAEDA